MRARWGAFEFCYATPRLPQTCLVCEGLRLSMNAAGKSGSEQNIVTHKITMSPGGHLWPSAAIPI